MKVRILHILAGLPPEGDAIVDFAARLAKAQKERGDDVVLAAPAGENLAVPAFEAEEAGVRLGRFAPSGNGPLHFSREMLHNLRKVVRGADTVHVHGVRSFPVWWGGLCALLEHKRLIFSPHGGLEPTHLAALSPKMKLLGRFDRFLLRRANTIHAASELEREWILAVPGLAKCADRIVVAPPGVELPRLMPKPKDHDTRTLLYYGPISQLGGLDLLLEAVVKCDAHRKLHLVICGPDEDGTKADLVARASQPDLAGKVTFLDPAYGMAKWRLFREADCFVLPARGDNFGLSVAEALACGIPAICTKGTPWQMLPEMQCGWWCDTSADGLAIAIRDMLYHYLPELVEMGANGRKLAERRFSWQAAAEKLGDAPTA